jgi:hypothetical protein
VKSENIKYQLKNRVFSEIKDCNHQLLHELVLKDFQRLEKLISLDLPTAQIHFDYSQLDVFSQSLLIDIPVESRDAVITYLISNYYQITPMGGLLDPLLRVNALSHLMSSGRIFMHQGRTLAFQAFGTRYRGYLDESPGRPGLHHDYQKLVCREVNDVRDIEISAFDFSFENNPDMVADLNKLDSGWKWEMMEVQSYIGSLPPTKYFEGDVVSIVDKQHPNYLPNETEGQCLVFRVNWSKDPLVYQIKLPNSKEMGEATAEQLSLQAKGVTRLFYNGTPPVRWKDLKSKAEFYLLLGLFKYHYNPKTDSYNWTLPSVKEAIKNGEGHAILRWKNTNFLISYTVDQEASFEPAEVVDATLAVDLVLSF